MANNQLWDELLTTPALKAGWHLARNDMRSDFIDDRYFSDAVANNLDPYIQEILRLLKTDTYRPKPLTPVDVPKNGLSVRPGTVMHLADRIVLFAIIKLIVPLLDPLLPQNVVYSYRYKAGDKHTLFHETDVLDIPFLKRSTIQKYIEPFEPWYALWPLFDERSKESIAQGYGYLVVSDISAYFENINLEILRALLYNELPGEQRIVNLLIECLEIWAVQTDNGFRPRRGIPQGSAISSFIGNIFLLPLDLCFEDLKESYDVKYFRYMDDVRIFCKDDGVARRMVFKLESVIRRLHLNLQSSKTKILDEKLGDVSGHLKDDRIEYLKAIREEVHQLKGKYEPGERAILRDRLWDLGRGRGNWDGKDKLCGNRKALSGLTLRAFRMWINILKTIGDGDYIPSLISEIASNPDHRLTGALVTATRTFPRRRRTAVELMKFLKSDLNIFGHQAAEIIHALRYTSRVGPEIRSYALERLFDLDEHFYVRMQCCTLTGRLRLYSKELSRLRTAFRIEENELVLSALLMPLGQLVGAPNQKFVKQLVHHTNERIRIIGCYISQLQSDHISANQFLKFVFDSKNEMRVCDYLGYIWYIVSSTDAHILETLIKEITKAAKHHKVMDLRERLSEILDIATTRLAELTA
jgi:retron-type reverse transcriptase